ncbi:hypothetical protein [Arthrobacter sp. Z1-15]
MSMNRQTIKEAKAEAQTFIKACDEALTRLDEELERNNRRRAEVSRPKPSDHSWGSAKTGTLRRKSMDLTRILATLRRYTA